MDEKVKINEDAFAAAVVEKFKISAPENNSEKFSKACLKIYLEAFILAQDFNTYEEKNYNLNRKTLFESFMESIASAQKSLNNDFSNK